MIHPKNQPSAYQLSDFTLKGERKATLKVDPETDYIVQVIAREDKGDLGIDYKYSDMVTAASGGSSPTPYTSTATERQPVYTTAPPPIYAKPQTKMLTAFPNPEPLQYDDAYDELEAPEETVSEDYTSTPWYIYECVPFIKELKGYDETSGSQNKLLESFIKQMNTKPLDMVNEFITSEKQASSGQCQDRAAKKSAKGFLKQCNNSTTLCCSSPWTTDCQNDCFIDYSPCDGNRCIPGKWVQDGWPDCLDGSDESSGQKNSLPEQLVCIQCAGVVLSAGFVCREARLGLTNQCIQDVMGAQGACNNCVSYYFDHLP